MVKKGFLTTFQYNDIISDDFDRDGFKVHSAIMLTK